MHERAESAFPRYSLLDELTARHLRTVRQCDMNLRIDCAKTIGIHEILAQKKSGRESGFFPVYIFLLFEELVIR